MCQIFNMSEFWIFVDFLKYDRVPNMHGDGRELWKGFEFQDSEYFVYASVAQGSEYAWIQLNNALWQGPEYAWSPFHRILNKPLILNMTRLRIQQGFEGYTGWWICLNKPEYPLMMSQYARICLNNAKYDWICWHIPEKIVLMQNNHKVIVQISEHFSRQMYSEHCQTSKMECFANRVSLECSCITRNFCIGRGSGVGGDGGWK